ncbi:AlkZ family DNA glycosylase [Amycolatopsis sp. 195334CR]|nr:AlkZ family DNA glycosylase [Amycolatopsis sp. 195334CR]
MSRAPQKKTSTDGEVLSLTALNRATLARQHLLARSSMSAAAALRHLVGMQAQRPKSPYFGLWTRLAGFRPEELSQLLLDRQAVRVLLMRGTIHLVTSDDCLALRPVVQPIMNRELATNSPFSGWLRGLDLAEVARAARELMAESPRTPADLGRLLAAQWPDREPEALAFAVRGSLPLVQVPPRGLWGRSGRTTCVPADLWLGREQGTETAPDELLRRYLAAFGPASVADMQAWSGLTRLREVVDRLRSELVTFVDENGTELFDLPEAPRPGAGVPAPPRFLPEFDNLLLAHADRRRVLPDEHRELVIAGKCAFLIDGRVAGTWRIAKEKKTAVLVIEPFAVMSTKDRRELAEEGRRLLAFAEPEAERTEIRF